MHQVALRVGMGLLLQLHLPLARHAQLDTLQFNRVQRVPSVTLGLILVVVQGAAMHAQPAIIPLAMGLVIAIAALLLSMHPIQE